MYLRQVLPDVAAALERNPDVFSHLARNLEGQREMQEEELTARDVQEALVNRKRSRGGGEVEEEKRKRMKEKARLLRGDLALLRAKLEQVTQERDEALADTKGLRLLNDKLSAALQEGFSRCVSLSLTHIYTLALSDYIYLSASAMGTIS